MGAANLVGAGAGATHFGRIVSEGLAEGVATDAGLAEAVNVYEGKVTNQAVAESFGMPCEEFSPRMS